VYHLNNKTNNQEPTANESDVTIEHVYFSESAIRWAIYQHFNNPFNNSVKVACPGIIGNWYSVTFNIRNPRMDQFEKFYNWYEEATGRKFPDNAITIKPAPSKVHKGRFSITISIASHVIPGDVRTKILEKKSKGSI